MRTTIRTGALTVLTLLAVLGGGPVPSSVAVDHDGGGCCGPLTLRSSTDIDEVVAVRKMEMAAYLVAHH